MSHIELSWIAKKITYLYILYSALTVELFKKFIYLKFDFALYLNNYPLLTFEQYAK